MNRTSITHCDAHDHLLVEALKHHSAGLFHHKPTLNFPKTYGYKKIAKHMKIVVNCY